MARSAYEDFIARKSVEWGPKFDASGLAKKFMPYFNSKRRIKVDSVGLDNDGNDVYGHTIITGTVSVTTGWKPVFILMRTSRSQGSPWTLGERDKIVAIWDGRQYRPL